MREEFLGSPLVPPPGSPLVPAECAVVGCPRAGFRGSVGSVRRATVSCARAPLARGRPADGQRGVAAVAVADEGHGVEREVRGGELPAFGGEGRLVPGARSAVAWPGDRRWTSSCAPRRGVVFSTGICPAPDCEFPASGWAGLCDRHLDTFHAWRHHRRALATTTRRSRRIWTAYLARGRMGPGWFGLSCLIGSCSSSSCRFVFQHLTTTARD